MSTRVIKCSICRRRYRGAGDWNVTVEQGVVVGHLCPGCQTPEQNAEAEINQATLDYIGDGGVGDGLLRARSRTTRGAR